MAKKKPYVKYQTVFNAVGGGLSNPGETRVCKVGAHKVVVTRADRLDRYGNPVHTATVIRKDGSMGASVRTNYATSAVSGALRKEGIETQYPNHRNAMKRIDEKIKKMF